MFCKNLNEGLDSLVNISESHEEWEQFTSNMWGKDSYRIFKEGNKYVLDRITGMRTSTDLGDFDTLHAAQEVADYFISNNGRPTHRDVLKYLNNRR